MCMLSAVHASWRNIGKMVESSRIEERAISDQLFNSDLCNAKKFRNGKAPCVLRRPLAFSLFSEIEKITLPAAGECGANCRYVSPWPRAANGEGD